MLARRQAWFVRQYSSTDDSRIGDSSQRGIQEILAPGNKTQARWLKSGDLKYGIKNNDTIKCVNG